MDLLGRYLWYDLMTPDPVAAKAFYTAVLGWGTAPFDRGGVPYTMWTRGETPVGGVMALSPGAGAPPHWLAYVATPDLDATFQKAGALGARGLRGPSDIPTVGRYAVISDPQGATLALFTPSSAPPGPPGTPQIGDVSWHELVTSNQESAFRFYSSLFGWRETGRFDMGPMGPYLMYGRHDGRALGGIFNKPPDMPAPPHWLYYVRVDDVRRVAAEVTRRGGKVLSGPMEVPDGSWIAQCLDPQGAAFAIHHDQK